MEFLNELKRLNRKTELESTNEKDNSEEYLDAVLNNYVSKDEKVIIVKNN